MGLSHIQVTPYIFEEHIENIERHLIHDLKQGSHKAFDKIYQMYSKRLYAYSLQFTKSSEESEEIVQEVFVKLWSNRINIRQDEECEKLGIKQQYFAA